MTPLGTERVRLRFALWPTTMSDQTVVWLMTYWAIQRRVQRTLKENAFWQTVKRVRAITSPPTG